MLACGLGVAASSLWPATTVPGSVSSRLLTPALAGLVTLVSLYTLALLLASLQTAWRTKWKLLPALPFVFCGYHFGYGIGFLKGVLDFAILKRNASGSMIGLTRESAVENPSARG